jgi:hypothetical protein
VSAARGILGLVTCSDQRTEELLLLLLMCTCHCSVSLLAGLARSVGFFSSSLYATLTCSTCHNRS